MTGGDLYPIDVVLKDLDLRPQMLSRYRGKNVLSVGEGVSDLLPNFIKNGSKATALDLSYDTTGLSNAPETGALREYIRKYGKHLVPGNARKMPIPDESQDLVVSHQLINNVSIDDKKSIVQEVIRVMKRGGTGLVFGFGEADLKEMNKFLSREYGQSLSVSFKKIDASWSVESLGKRKQINQSAYPLTKCLCPRFSQLGGFRATGTGGFTTPVLSPSGRILTEPRFVRPHLYPTHGRP